MNPLGRLFFCIAVSPFLSGPGLQAQLISNGENAGSALCGKNFLPKPGFDHNSTNVSRQDDQIDTIASRVEPLVQRIVEAKLIPGFQIAVCTSDGSSWNGAYGIADLESGRRVKDGTRFYIASTSKAITGLAAARLNHRGELNFKDSLSEVFPGVKFPEGYNSEQVTVQDLLTHTHGLGQSPLSARVAFLGNFNNDELRNLIQHLDVRQDRKFRYANIGYDLTGLLLSPEKTHGWKDVVQREVISPLGMTHTTAFRSSLTDEQLAFPHEVSVNGQQRIKLSKFDENMGPAGGHFSTATDLIRLVQIEMGDGLLDGQQLIAKAVIDKTRSEIVKQDRQFAIYERYAWGIGWDIGKYGDEVVIHRPGGFAGYYSNVAYIPRRGVGIAVLGNGGQIGAGALEALAGAIYDEFSGKAEVRVRLDRRIVELKQSVLDLQRRAASQIVSYADKPKRQLSSYVGTYTNGQWGNVVVSESKNGLELEWGVIRETLRPLQNGSEFHVQILRSTDGVDFEFDENEQATKVSIRTAFRVSFHRLRK